jgi:hypothetical protein
MTIQSSERGDLGRACGGPTPFFSNEIQPLPKDIERTEHQPAFTGNAESTIYTWEQHMTKRGSKK